jgi:uncharacterized protein (DUF58 family)
MVYTDLASLVRLQHEARDFSFLPRQPVHSILSGKYASRLRGRGMDFEEVRSYAPGDDIRTIDWKVTARTREPHTKIYNEERERPVLFVVDQTASMFFGSQTSMKSVTAAEATALGAWRVLKQGDRVGGVVFGRDDTLEVKPRRSQKAVLQLLQAVVILNNELKPGQPLVSDRLNQALQQAERLAHHDFLIVPISDFSQANDDTTKLMGRMAQHNDLLAIHVSDPMEREIPASEIVLSDGDQQLSVNPYEADLRGRFKDDFDQRLLRLQARLMSYRIPVLRISTVGDLGRQVRKQLGQQLAKRRIR